MCERTELNQLRRTLVRKLPECESELAMRALTLAIRSLAIQEYGNLEAARAASTAVLRDAFAAEVAEVATGIYR